MKLTREQIEGRYTIHAFQKNEAILNALPGDAGRDEDGRVTLHRSFIITPEKVQRDWPIAGISQLKDVDIADLYNPEMEVLLLGTGRKLHFPSTDQLAALIKLGIGYEVMDSAAACRTYNVLVGEGRKVGAAIILERDEG
jgi:uncharacterized protein